MSEEETHKISVWFSRRKSLFIGIGTICLIILMIYFIDFSDLIQKVILIGFWGLFLFIVSCTIVFFFRSYKLNLIFKGINQEISYSTCYFSIGAGLIINEFTPGKIGDLARIFIMKDQEDLKLSDSVAGLTIERVLDFIFVFIISIFALILLYMYRYGDPNVKIMLGQNIQFFLAISIILLIGIFIALILLIYRTEFIIRILDKISPKLAEYLSLFITNFKEGMKKFRNNKKEFICTVLLEFPTWILDTFILILFFYILGYQINMFIIILASTLINLSKSFPITPGGWIISENIGALFIFFFYPEIPYTGILAVFVIDHLLRSGYLSFYGGYSVLHYNVKLKELKELKKMN